ncbi:hypothetical protein CRG98_044296, partial [Punica granatum]
MGNNCVSSRYTDSLLQSISSSLWWTRANDGMAAQPRINNSRTMPVDEEDYPPSPPSVVAESKAPAPVKMTQEKPFKAEENRETNKLKKKSLGEWKRQPSAGLMADSVLQTKTGNLKDYYTLGRKLGHGQYGTTFLCVEKSTGKKYACKSISKRKLLTVEDLEDVRREIQIMHHISGNPNVISIKGAYEDSEAVHAVMELCSGGELFDRIVSRGHYSEKKAANLARTIVSAVEACHSLGVIHRDLKPENLLFVDEKEDSPLKAIDFGLSVFFKPGDVFTDVMGSSFYVAPEILQKRYGPEADVWSAGVIIYILLCGVPPFWA